MNILVCGGAGYIGSAATEALLHAGHNVTVCDSLITGHRHAVPDKAVFIQADLNDNERLKKVFSRKWRGGWSRPPLQNLGGGLDLPYNLPKTPGPSQPTLIPNYC